MAELGIGVLLALLITGAARWLLARRRESRAYRREFRDRFFALADRVATHEDMDAARLEQLRLLLNNLDGAAAAARVSRALAACLAEIRAGTRFAPSAVPETIRADWLELNYLALMALSYDRWLSGVILRAQFATLLDPARIERIEPLIGARARPGAALPA
jgi:hypothetical protein